MAYTEGDNPPQIDKEVVKDALQEILYEIPAFRTFAERGRHSPPGTVEGSSQTDTPLDPKDTEQSNRGQGTKGARPAG